MAQTPPELDYGVRFKLIRSFSLGPSRELGIFSAPFLASAGRKAAYPLPSAAKLPPTTRILLPLLPFPLAARLPCQ